MAKQPKGRTIGEGPAAFSRQSTPAGRKVPKATVSRAASTSTGLYPADVTGLRDNPNDPNRPAARSPTGGPDETRPRASGAPGA